MRWSCLLLFAAMAAGCATEGDERPLTFEAVTLDVLKPSCGQVQCHSTTTWERGYAFDTLQAAKYTLCSSGIDVFSAINGVDGDRMPPDVPLAKKDEELLIKWDSAGNPGLDCSK